MKKIIISIAASALVLAASSCSDYLEEEVKVGAAPELAFSTASGIEGLVANTYSFARGWYGKEAGLGLSEMGTDLFYYGYDNKQKSLNSYNITAESLDGNTSDNASLDQYWELFYSAVDVCNRALHYVPQNEFISDSKKDQFMAEAFSCVLSTIGTWSIFGDQFPTMTNHNLKFSMPLKGSLKK